MDDRDIEFMRKYLIETAGRGDRYEANVAFFEKASKGEIIKEFKDLHTSSPEEDLDYFKHEDDAGSRLWDEMVKSDAVSMLAEAGIPVSGNRIKRHHFARAVNTIRKCL